MSAPFEVKQNVGAFEVKQSRHPALLSIYHDQDRPKHLLTIPDFQVEQRKWNPEVTFFFFFRKKNLYIIYAVVRALSRLRAGTPTGGS